MERRWAIMSDDNGATWYAQRVTRTENGNQTTFTEYRATNLPNSLIQKCEAQLTAIKVKSGFAPTDTFIRCRIRPKGVPENAGQRNSTATVTLNMRIKGGEQKNELNDLITFIVTNQEYDSLTWVVRETFTREN